MAARLFAFLIWALLAASVIFWGLRLSAGTRPVPSHALATSADVGGGGDISRLLGREAAVQPAEQVVASTAQIQLLGVAAPRQGGDRQGLALLAVEGKPPRAYRVGMLVDETLVLMSVGQRTASLGPVGTNAPTLTLEIPALPPPATGTPGGAGMQERPEIVQPPAPPRRSAPRNRRAPPAEAPPAQPAGDAPPADSPPAGAEPPPGTS